MNVLDDIRGLDEHLTIDSSGDEEDCLLVTEDGRHIRVSSSARQLLCWVRDGRDFSELAESLSRKKGYSISAEQLRNAYNRLIELIEESKTARSISNAPAGFWFRVRLLPASIVDLVASRLIWLFRPGLAVFLLSCVVGLIVYCSKVPFSDDMDPLVFWHGYGLFLISLMAHEFGHASACSRYGAAPSDIGFIIYMIYPAFYSDVTSAWQLKRWQRIVVDLGGNYFQYLGAGLYCVVFLLSGWNAFRVAVFMVIYCSAFSLNPIFKFDGYWLVTDALGVTNLSQHPMRIMRYLLRWARGLKPEPLPWPRTVTMGLFGYAIGAFAFWGYVLWRLVPLVFQRSLAYPGKLWTVLAALARNRSFDHWSEVQDVAVSTAVLFVAYLMLFRMMAMIISSMRWKLKSYKQREKTIRSDSVSC